MLLSALIREILFVINNSEYKDALLLKVLKTSDNSSLSRTFLPLSLRLKDHWGGVATKNIRAGM